MVLHHFVLHHTHARLFRRHLRERNSRIGGSQRSAAKNRVHLLLRKRRELLLRFFYARRESVEFGKIGDRHGFLHSMEGGQAALSRFFPPLPRFHDGRRATRLSVTLVTAAYNVKGTKPGLPTKKPVVSYLNPPSVLPPGYPRSAGQ